MGGGQKAYLAVKGMMLEVLVLEEFGLSLFLAGGRMEVKLS